LRNLIIWNRCGRLSEAGGAKQEHDCEGSSHKGANSIAPAQLDASWPSLWVEFL
jgi:hypothetical protein